MIFSKLHFFEYSSRRRTLSGGGEQYGGQGCIVVAARGWPKLKSSGLNQEPTKKKASQFDTLLGKFPSCWFDQNFRHEVPGSTRKFLVQPGISCLFQELFCFLLQSFVVIGQENPKNHKLKLFFIEWSPPYLGSCYLHVDHILPTTPSPFKGKYSVKPLGKGFKNGISIMDGGWKDFHLMGFKLCTNLYLVMSTKKF